MRGNDMLTRIKNIVAAPVFDDREKTRTAGLLNTILWGLMTILLAASPVLIAVNESRADVIMTAGLIAGFTVVDLVSLWLLRRGHVQTASVLLCTLSFLTIAAATFIFGGIRSNASAGYLAVIFTSGLLLGQRGAIIFGALSLLSVVLTFYAEYYLGIIVRSPRATANYDNLFMILMFSSAMIVMVNLAARNINNALSRAFRNEQALGDSLEDLKASRDALRARTQQLKERSSKLRAAAEIARDATTEHQLVDLLNKAVRLIQGRFGFYHAAIFLTDQTGEHAVLRAQTSEAAIERQHRLGMGHNDPVSYVIDRGMARVFADRASEAGHPLPETRSEMVLPLRVGRRTIGALDIRSREADAFSEDGVVVFQTMADQIAAAIENVRLLEEMEETVRELQAASGRYTRESWKTIAQGSHQTPAYRYRRAAIEPISEQPPEVREAWLEGRPVLVSKEPGSTGDGKSHAQTAAIPIKLRDEVISVFKLRSEDGDISPEVLSLVKDVADRVALALENARLLQESRNRAARERLTAEIATHLRATLDIETVLATAAEELRDALDADAAEVWVEPEDQ